MSRITSKYQVTVPKAIAERYGLVPGDEIDWTPAGDTIRVTPAGKGEAPDGVAERLRLFDQATERQRCRVSPRPRARVADRGWRRKDLYTRGRSR